MSFIVHPFFIALNCYPEHNGFKLCIDALFFRYAQHNNILNYTGPCAINWWHVLNVYLLFAW